MPTSSIPPIDDPAWWQAFAAVSALMASIGGFAYRQLHRLVAEEASIREKADDILRADQIAHDAKCQTYELRVLEKLADLATKSDLLSLDRRIEVLVQAHLNSKP